MNSFPHITLLYGISLEVSPKGNNDHNKRQSCEGKSDRNVSSRAEQMSENISYCTF